MDETRKQDFLTDFSKHVPLVLTQQLIATQAYQYVNTQSPGSLKPNDHGKFALESCSSRERNKKLMTTTLPVPSIERFYGAVLFVDISGFTLLSQRLDVESLKNHINAYFSKILEIVERWGGDVVKFAGDAVYVVWPTKVEKGRQAGHHDAKHHHRNHVNHLGSSSSQDSKRSHLQFVSNTMRSSSFLSVAQNQNQVKASATEATDRAIRCGVEIIEQCGELPVFLDTTKVTIKKSNKSHGRLSSFVANIANKILSRSAPIGPDVPNSDYIAYLNIHAGVGIGLLAGVDIGVEDRWEYFLIGDPLSEVAVAESLADKGDIVVTTAAHTLFHPKSVVKAEFAETKDSCDSPGATIRNGVRLSCGCVKLTEECVLVKRVKATADSQPSEKSPTSPTAIRDKGRGKSMVASRSTPNLQPQMVESSVRYEAICNEIRNAMTFVTPIMKEEYNRGISVHCKRSVVDPDLTEDSLSRKEDVAFNVKMLEKRLPSFLQGKVRPHFLACIERGLVHQLIGHVHDVVRPDDYVLFPRYNAREENFEKMLRRFLSSEKMRSRQPTVDKYAFAKILQAVGDNVATSNSSIEIGSESRDELDVPLALEPLKKGVSQLLQLSTKTQLVQHNIEAELRTVTVMFIKIDSFDMSLLIDTSLVKEGRKTTRYDPAFGFLDRTENEQTADQLILLRLQRCMEVLHRAIYDHGGQLRQFIVDDKGTVCIASFGLRGSVNEDNAANALEAANTVIRELQEQGLGSSIGVTTGKVYCGLVGSMMRHEFALMGPSVNLSARLMGKATLGSILCDHETMQRDRAHDFKHVGDIKAKGYEDLVPTYRPTFGHAFDEQVKLPLIVDRRPAGEHHTAVPDSAAPYAKRYSSLRFSVAMDPHQFRSFTTFLRTKSVPGLEKLKMMIDSDFFVTDEAHAALFESMATRPRASISSDVSSMYKGCRPLRGRKTEIDRLLRFLFSERHSEDSLASTEGPSRLAVVVASGGVGKTALLSAVGRKLFSTAKQDGKCNVTVLRNRSNTLGGNMRMNPWKPILLELLRLVHKTMTALNRSASRLDPNGFESSVSSARISRRRHNSSIHMMLKEDSIQDYVSVADFIFSRLPSDLRSFRPLVLNMLGYVSDQAMPAPTESTASGRPLDTRVRDTTQILEAIFNFSVGYTKKVIVVIIEDAQSMDAASREVLQLLWQRCCGVHFVLSLLAEADLDHAKGVTRLNTSRWDMTSASVESKGDASSLDGGGEESPGRQCRALYSFLSYFVQEQSEVTAGRFLAIELATLNKTATAELIHDILDSPSQEAMEGAAVEDRVRQLVSASGGHPLYTVQLATNLLLELQNVASDSAKEPPTGSAPSPTAITAASPTAMHMEVLHMSTMQRRVEEIICFRLDRLDAAAQIILKAATVCASHGRGFSADLVAFMLRHCPRLNATVMATLLSNYDEEDATDTQTSLEDFRSASQRLDPLVMQVVIVLKALSRRGAFVRARASDVTDSCDPSDEAYDAYVLAEGELLASEGGPTASMAEELFEFCIPTEQSTIYSLVIDELREYFHGKIAQYFYCKIAEKRLDDVVFAPSSFEAALTASSKRRAVSSAVANATPAVLEEEGQATAAAEVDLTEKIRAWLVLEIEIAYHAEQANLWPVAMRANMCVAMLERRTKNHRGMISALLEAFKVFKCYEQESETLLTPIPYAKLSTETDLGRTVHRFLLMSATHAGSFPPEYYADLEVLREHFSDDLENVCQVFGLDVLMISHAVKLHLFLADYYLVGFGELSHVPDILGIVVKLLLAVAVLKFMEQQAPPGQADSSPSAMLSQMDAGNLMRLETAALSAVIDSLDLSHFYNTTYALGSVNLQAFSVLSLDFLRNDLAPLFARAGEGGAALHCGMMLVQHLSRHDLRSAQAHWLAEHGTAAVPAETLPSLFQLGLDQRVTALGLFLYQLVCIEPSDLSDPQTAQLVEHVLGRLFDFMRVYEHTIFMFADVVPVFMALARLQRWSLINEIATVFLRESEVEAHEVMAAQVAFLRHFQSWSEGLMRVLRLSPVEPAAGDAETLVQRLLAATRFFAGDRINEGVRLLCDTFVSAPPPPSSAAAASAPRHTEVVAACLVTIHEESQLFTLDQIVLQLIAFAFVLLAEPPADAADSVDQPDGAAAQTTFASSGRPLSSERQATLTNVLTHQLHVLGRERHSLSAAPRSAASRAVYRNKLTQCHALLSVVADQHPALRDLLQASPEFVGLVQL